MENSFKICGLCKKFIDVNEGIYYKGDMYHIKDCVKIIHKEWREKECKTAQSQS